MSGFGLYVHWPFCAAKCPYCDFNSHVRSSIDEDGCYADADIIDTKTGLFPDSGVRTLRACQESIALKRGTDGAIV